MRAGEHAGEHAVDHLPIADDDARDLLAQRADLSEDLDFVANALGFCHASFPRTDQLEVAADVKAIASGDIVLLERLFGHVFVLHEDVVIALADEAALGGAGR